MDQGEAGLAAAAVRFVATPAGETLPFIAMRPHRVRGQLVPQRMLYPSAEMLAEAVAKVPVGTATSLAAIRTGLARQHGAESTCPVTTQRQMAMVAAATVAAFEAGASDITPFWRAFDASRPAAARLPGGADFIAARQREERD